MRILITGGAGMLGTCLVPVFVSGQHELVVTDIDLQRLRPWGERGPTLAHLDVRSRDEVSEAFASIRPDLVLHLAAETSLEICEQDPDHAFLTNAIATKYIALACRRYRIPLVYISTAGVFDGTKAGAYTEFDTPRPINVYGSAKLEGEHFVRELVEEHYILRAGWMVGGGPGKDHKFVARILRQLTEGKTVLHAVVDKLGTPTYAPDFARCLEGVLGARVFGTYHAACGGDGSRYDVAAEILSVLGRTDVELVAVESDFFAKEFPAPRPASEILRNMALELQSMNTMRPWRVALQDYLQTAFPHLISRSIDVTDRHVVLA